MEAIQNELADSDKRTIGRVLRVSLIGAVALAVILLVLLAFATANTRGFQGHYTLLFWLTVGVAIGLFGLVVELMRRLIQRYRRGLFGTRLMARMALSFTLMTVVPVMLIYLIAVVFVGRSIEYWFDVPLERALESGLNLGRAALDATRSDLVVKARAMAIELIDTNRGTWPQTLNRMRDQNAVQEAVILTGAGRIITTSGGQFAPLVPDLPSSDQLRRARLTRLYSEFEGGAPARGEPTLKLRLIIALGAEGRRPDESTYLQLIHYVPNALADSAEAVAQGRTNYQQLISSRVGLKRLFRVTLTLIFFLTAFAAIAAAFLLSGWLTGPLSMLAAGTRAVAEGDFRPVKDYSGRDELGVLTQSFNAMTHQLQEARLLVERNQRELEQVNARLESVLANLTAGVLVLDADFKLTLANAGAERILGLSLVEYLYDPIASVPRLGQLAESIRIAFNDQVSEGAPSWQRQFVLQRDAGATEVGSQGIRRPSEQTILARGSILPEQRVGYVIVFDDITSLVSAQRSVAWAEVARRLAHEIKNPLTPIQLAAERMHLKLAGKLPPAEAALLEKSAATIINQVGALKLMVDEFREYARLPAAQLAPLDLNGLIEDVAGLYSAGGPDTLVHMQLAADLPQVMGDRTQLRQLVHNLVKNATEAIEQNDAPRVDLITERIELPLGRRGVRLRVIDNGHGFSDSVLGRVFEPYVTTKSRGTGLGLAIVKKIVDEHGARIDASNVDHVSSGGAQVSVLFTKLAESDDNSQLNETATQRV